MSYSQILGDIRDSNGEPMIFSIDDNDVLSVAIRSEDSATGWVRRDLSGRLSGNLKAQAFGVSQNSSGDIYLVLAAGKDRLGPSQLFEAPKLPNDPASPIWEDFGTRWRPIRMDPAPSSRITEVLLDAPETDDELPLIVVGTSELAGRVPKYLRIMTGLTAQTVEHFPTLPNADELLDIQVGRPPGSRGVYVLYRLQNTIALEFAGTPDPEFNVPLSFSMVAPPGAMALQPKVNDDGFTDLYVLGNGKFLFRSQKQLANARAEKASDLDETLADNITSRSALTQDYRPTPKALNPYSVYRTSISLPPLTSHVDIWASEEVEVEVNGKRYKLDPVMPVRVAPSALSKISLSIPARELHCPTLMLHTNLMRPEQRHIICPDVEVHKKIADLEDGALHAARDRLGIRPEFTKEHLDQVQKSLQSIARTIQYTHNKKPHGVHHDRALLPANMDDPHFMLDFRGNQASYKPLDKAQVAREVAGARRLDGNAGQSLWDDVVNFFENAESIIVHTVEAVGNKIVDTAERVGRDVVEVVDRVGEDLVHGDLLRIPGDLLQGGENIGRDLFSGAANVVGELVSGAGQLVVITLKLAGQAVQFVLDNTGPVGKVLGLVLEKIGAAVEKAVIWLLDQIDWTDVLHAHDYLIDTFNQWIDKVRGQVAEFKKQADDFFSGLEGEISHSIDETLKYLGTKTIAERASPHPAFSGAMEAGEWLLSKHTENAPSLSFTATAGPIQADHPAVQTFIDVVQERIGQGGNTVLSSFDEALTDIKALFSSPEKAPELALSALLNLAKGVALAGLQIVNAILDALLDLVAEVLKQFKELANGTLHLPFVSDLYSSITGGRELSLLRFASFLISIPLSILSKAMWGRPAFAGSGRVAASLPPPTKDADRIKDWGTAYEVIHFIQASTATASDILSARSALKVLKARSVPTPPSSEPKQTNWGMLGLSFVNLMLDGFSQFTANPIGYGNDGIETKEREKKYLNAKDVKDGPDRFAWIIWDYQLALWVVEDVILFLYEATDEMASKPLIEDPVRYQTCKSIFTFMRGAAHMGLMSALDVADRKKFAHLKEFFVTDGSGRYTTSNDESWQSGWGWKWKVPDGKGGVGYPVIRPEKKGEWDAFEGERENYAKYLHWAEFGGGDDEPEVLGVKRLWGIERKGFGNIMDTFPEVVALGTVPAIAEATEGVSLAVSAILDVLGHLGEAITYEVRLRYNEMY